jgi:hypothetical protein
LAGPTRGTEYDAIDVADRAALDGTLEIVLIDGFTPSVGDRFRLIDGSVVSGTFHSVTLPTLENGIDWAMTPIEGGLAFEVALQGDIDLSGTVDAADYIALKTHMGTGSSGTWCDGDLDRDGDVDWSDLELLMGNIGRTSGAASGLIPEPATLCLLALGGLAVMRRRP